MGPKKFELRLGITAPSTTLAFDQEIRAVQLEQTFRACASQRVKPVDVLRDDGQDFARFFQPNDSVVHCIRLRASRKPSHPSSL